MPKRVLIVTKHIGEFQVYEPVVRLLRSNDIEVVIVAEGLSEAKWQDAGYGTHGSDIGDEEARLFLDHLRPNVVLTGLGAPINLGEKYGLAANKLGIKLGFVHDLWGVHKRSKAIPDFVCVTDSFDAGLVNQYYFYRGREKPLVYTTGSPAMDNIIDTKEDPMTKRITNGVNGRTIVVIGQNECTTPMLEGLMQALDSKEEPYLLIPRFHPNFVNNDGLRHRWLSVLYGAKKGSVYFAEPSVSTRQLVWSADFTVSVFSTVLLESALLGTPAISWMSPLGKHQMKASLGVEHYPLVSMGCAGEVSTAEEWDSYFDPFTDKAESLVKNCESRLRSDGKNTERVFDVIMMYLG